MNSMFKVLFLAFLLSACSNETSISSLSSEGLGLDKTSDDIVVIDDNQQDQESSNENESDEEIQSDNLDNENDMDDVVTDSVPELDSDESSDENVADEDVTNEDEINNDSNDDSENRVCQSSGNLIKNGSFEKVDDSEGLARGLLLSEINSKGKWDVFKALPLNTNKVSWYASSGSGIEVQYSGTVVEAKHGQRYVELDSHTANSNSGMSQDIELEKGKYIVKFLYYARTNELDDNTIEVLLNDKIIKIVNEKKSGQWKMIRVPLRIKEKAIYKITFRAAGKENSLGGFVDKVRMHRVCRRAGVSTVLLALGDKDNIASPMIKREIAEAVISKAVNFSSIVRKPKVLLVRDRRHNNESPDDFVLVKEILSQRFETKVIDEPLEGLQLAHTIGFDLIWLINPGHPMGNAVSAATLMSVKAKARVGIVISGDDMARGRNFNVSELTGLDYKHNGTSFCGERIDNNRGKSYSVILKKKYFPKLSASERILKYANDIDFTTLKAKNLKVMAYSEGPKDCGYKIPTVVGYKIKKETPEESGF